LGRNLYCFAKQYIAKPNEMQGDQNGLSALTEIF